MKLKAIKKFFWPKGSLKCNLKFGTFYRTVKQKKNSTNKN